MKDIPFPQLQAFLAVARTNSFAAAARDLGVSRSAVSPAQSPRFGMAVASCSDMKRIIDALELLTAQHEAISSELDEILLLEVSALARALGELAIRSLRTSS